MQGYTIAHALFGTAALSIVLVIVMRIFASSFMKAPHRTAEYRVELGRVLGAGRPRIIASAGPCSGGWVGV